MFYELYIFHEGNSADIENKMVIFPLEHVFDCLCEDTLEKKEKLTKLFHIPNHESFEKLKEAQDLKETDGHHGVNIFDLDILVKQLLFVSMMKDFEIKTRLNKNMTFCQKLIDIVSKFSPDADENDSV
ncbi:MAG: hypothetical protein K0U78_11670 [Actinomycetia bacterium]|nr:hypothetical protein [Actinomycetes bacterium]